MGLHAQSIGQVFYLAHVTRFDPARNYVDRLSFRFRRFGKIIDHRPGHVRETRHVRTNITGRIGVNDPFSGGNLSLVLRLRNDLGDVVSDGFRKACGVYSDNIRLVHAEHIGNGLEQIGLPAENRRAFGERTSGRHNRLFVVPRERAAMVRAATLRAVAMRQTFVYA